MANAFTAGVKPGGLTTGTEIKILLCYIIKTVKTPLTRKEIEDALLSEALVNYFEISTALSELIVAGHICETNNTFSITKTGENLAELLQTDIPITARERALKAVLAVQQYNIKDKQHKTEIVCTENGFMLNCGIEEMGECVFSFSIYLPDLATAEYAQKCFVENGADVYSLLLAGLTNDKQIAKAFMDKK